MMNLLAIRRRRGSILLLILWMLIVLGLIGLSYSFSVRTQVQVTTQSEGKREAYWAARAGIEKARAMLNTTDFTTPLVDTDPLFNDPDQFADQPVGRAMFSLIVPQVTDDEEPKFGIIDESSRLNVNKASKAMLMRFIAVTDEMADSLIDWRDADDDVQPSGAEGEYYESLEDPYPAHNAPIATVAELQRVLGWGPVFEGAYPDPYAKFLPEDKRPEAEDPIESRLLLESLTAWSTDKALAPDGQAKLALSQVTANQITSRGMGINQTDAQAIVDYRSQRQYSSPADLINVTRSTTNNQATGGNTGAARGGTTGGGTTTGGAQGGGARGGGGGGGRGGRGGTGGGATGGAAAVGGGATRTQTTTGGNTNTQSTQTNTRVFNLQRVAQFVDYFATQQTNTQTTTTTTGGTPASPGLININTASYDVLLTVDGITEDLAQAIIDQREANGAFTGAGQIATLGGVDETNFAQIYPQITASSSRFHVYSRGVEPASKATVMIEAVLSYEDTGVDIVYWREL